MIETGLWSKDIDTSGIHDVMQAMVKQTEKEYDLWVRFGGSDQQLCICRGTHKDCMHAADIMYRFIVLQGRTHKPMLIYNRQAVTPDRIIVGYQRTAGTYASKNAGLWATFTIEEVQKEKTYE